MPCARVPGLACFATEDATTYRRPMNAPACSTPDGEPSAARRSPSAPATRVKPAGRIGHATPDKAAARGISRPATARRLRTAAAAIVVVFLGACATWPTPDDAPVDGELLQNSLPVAAAALAAGQLDVARRLYVSLSDRYRDAPAPLLGLGYIAFIGRDFVDAEKHFLQAAERAADAPAMHAEALLGAGRAALVQGRTETARQHLRHARASGEGTHSAAWIANGLAVVATLRADYAAAGSHYADALRLSSVHPRIAANFVRMLVAAGRIDDAAREYGAHPPAFWSDGDGPALSRLVEEARRNPPPRAPARTGSGSSPDAPALRSPLGLLDPALSLRLDKRSSAGARPEADTSPSGEPAPPDPSRPGLGADRRPAADPPAPAANDGAPALASDADPPASDGQAPAGSTSGADPAGVAPAQAAASEAARPSPVPDPEAAATLDPSSAPSLALAVGQSRRLHLDRHASSVAVAAPDVADVQLLAPDVLYVIGKSVGRTSVAVLDDRERVGEWVVSVELDLEPLRAVLAREPGFEGVGARRLTRGVALTGEVASAEAADRALRLAAGALPEEVTVENELRIAAPLQVNLEVQIAEVHRAVTEDLGVNWEAFRVRGNEGFGFRIGHVSGGIHDLPDPYPVLPPLSVPGSVAPTLVDGQVSPSVYFGRSSSNTRIAAMVDALATAGLANVLARPNLTAVSGESASFFSGGEFPLPTGFDDGVLVFEYKKYGVLLDFVPTVVDPGRIVLTVRPEVSEPSRNQSVTVVQGVNVPVINVRRAETTVEVADGESIVVAGLFRNASNTVEAGLPGLKDVPLFGLLFGSTSVRSDELELIVIVTARLVEPNESPDDTDAPAATLQADGYHY